MLSLIILFPFKEQLYEGVVAPHRPDLELTKPNKIVMNLCAIHAIACFDLLPEFDMYKDNKLYWDYDPHLTQVGQFYASIEVESIFKEHDIVPTR